MTSNPPVPASALKIYLPLLDNGNGDVKANFMICHHHAFAGRDVVFDRASDSHADRGMNKIANAFLASDCDVWLTIDADIHFTRRDIDNLLSHAMDPDHPVPLVYGIYPKKQEDAPPCLGTFEELPVPDVRNLATVRRCGRGFMAVRRELLEQMKEDNGGPAVRYHNHGKTEWNFFASGPVEGAMSALSGTDPDGFPLREWISEDWMFCERARALGVPTLVDVRIALGHEGSKVYRFGQDQLVRTDWENVRGWFSEGDAGVYQRIADAVPHGGAVAEVGCWMGRSLCALSTFLFERQKGVHIHAIDTFQGAPGDEIQAEAIRDLQSKGSTGPGNSVRAVFERNLLSFGVRPQIYEMPSLEAAAKFADGSLDAVFIDGDHSYEAVEADINAWLPKVKSTGILAGHDYDDSGVHAAVNSFFPGEVETIGRCWLVRI